MPRLLPYARAGSPFEGEEWEKNWQTLLAARLVAHPNAREIFPHIDSLWAWVLDSAETAALVAAMPPRRRADWCAPGEERIAHATATAVAWAIVKPAGEFALVHMLEVLEPARRRGFGSALLAALEQRWAPHRLLPIEILCSAAAWWRPRSPVHFELSRPGPRAEALWARLRAALSANGASCVELDMAVLYPRNLSG